MSAIPKPPTIPFGLWPSPISARSVAAGTRRFGVIQGDGSWVYWTEGRPEEKGRQTLMRRRPGAGAPEELLAAPFSARSRVHEYGGGEFLAAGEVIFFVNDADQDIYEATPGLAPRRLTAAPDLRFADLTLDRPRGRLIAVAEQHRKGTLAPDNLLVAVALEGSRRGRVTELAATRDFYAAPRLSPDGRALAFLAWDLPGMPWDEASLSVARLDADGAMGPKPRRIAGGDGVAASYPAFAPDGRLIFIEDAGGWGNFCAFDGETVLRLTRLKQDFGRPMWSLGTAPYAIDGGGTIWAAPAPGVRAEGFGLSILSMDTHGRRREWHEIAENSLDGLTSFEGGLAGQASAGDAPSSITAYTLGAAYSEIKVRWSFEAGLADEDIAKPQMVAFKGAGGAKTFAVYYPPAPGGRARPPRGAKPPAIVLAHGGPTSAAGRGLALGIQFYTSRGFAVLDVDYAGSTGYGRTYRARLDGQWGIADVADCAAGAHYLGREGLADPTRIAISGGSAGGYTVLMALATTAAFAAGSSRYGICDLALLLAHTHKFESGYLHRLMGTSPKTWKTVFARRSPINLIDGITAPVVLFQGLEDRVVPPEQSRLIAERLRAKGTPVELHEFAGEGHGFRRAETIAALLESELAFFRRAMGLTPPS